MTAAAFKAEIERVGRNWPGCMGEERVKLIWQRVQDLPDTWFKRTVDSMIETLRQAPMVPDFDEAARQERIRIHEESKAEDRKKYSNWTNQFVDPKDKLRAQAIIKRARGEMPDQEWDEFLEREIGKAGA